MLKKTSNGVYQSSLLASIPGLIHGYSSRQLGDMKTDSARKLLLMNLNLKSIPTTGQQIHGNKIGIVTAADRGKVVPNVDGLVGDIKDSPVLGVRTADCVPILAVDPVSKIIGAAHSGWRGTYANIAGKLITSMKKSGAGINNIYVSVGPHIGSCCYDIDTTRAEKFVNGYGKDSLIRRDDHIYLNLAGIIRDQLIKAGILSAHVDDELLCNSCNILEFFSYRKDDKKKYGEILGVISFNYGKN